MNHLSLATSIILSQLIFQSCLSPYRELQLRHNQKRFGRVYGSRVTEHIRLDTDLEIYDLAGQSEYCSSHAAMFESLCLESPAIFVIVVDLTKSEEQLAKEIYSWTNFIEAQSSGISSHVIVVGSRKDKFSWKPRSFERKCTFVELTAKKALENLHFAGFVALDSRQLSSDSAVTFLILMMETVNNLVAPGRNETMSFACHLISQLLKEKVEEKTIDFNSIRNLVCSDGALSALSEPETLASFHTRNAC